MAAMCGAALEGGKLQRFTDRAVLLGALFWVFGRLWVAGLLHWVDGEIEAGHLEAVCVLEVVSSDAKLLHMRDAGGKATWKCPTKVMQAQYQIVIMCQDKLTKELKVWHTPLPCKLLRTLRGTAELVRDCHRSATYVPLKKSSSSDSHSQCGSKCWIGAQQMSSIRFTRKLWRVSI